MIDGRRLKLTLRDITALENGVPPSLVLAQCNAIIGRAATADWSLPDPRSFISSRHCEIAFAHGEYRLTDRSTNGTFLNGSAERMRGPHILCDGDVIHIGHYEAVVRLEGDDEQAPPPSQARDEWKGWAEPSSPAANAGPPGWGPDNPSRAASHAVAGRPVPIGQPLPTADWGPVPPAPSQGPASSGGWDASPSLAPAGLGAAQASGPGSGRSAWDAEPAQIEPSSPWSSAGSSAAPGAEDAWGKLAKSYAVDWTRGGFAAPSEPAVPPEQGAFIPPAIEGVRPDPGVPAPQTADDEERRRVTRRAADTALAQFLSAAGLDPAMIRGQEPEVMAAAGGLLRQLVAGLVVMMEARTRAKAQMGAQGTIFSREGNNPVKFARTPEAALAQLLNPPLSGYMGSDRAVEDSYRDLQLHQIATLKAMQGALRATLERFSPTAVRKRSAATGLLRRILPGARDAALWQAYEREFSGVTQGSDEAFMDVFAKEFRKAYEASTGGL